VIFLRHDAVVAFFSHPLAFLSDVSQSTQMETPALYRQPERGISNSSKNLANRIHGDLGELWRRGLSALVCC
jgi:hypothetical protein